MCLVKLATLMSSRTIIFPVWWWPLCSASFFKFYFASNPGDGTVRKIQTRLLHEAFKAPRTRGRWNPLDCRPQDTPRGEAGWLGEKQTLEIQSDQCLPYSVLLSLCFRNRLPDTIKKKKKSDQFGAYRQLWDKKHFCQVCLFMPVIFLNYTAFP